MTNKQINKKLLKLQDQLYDLYNQINAEIDDINNDIKYIYYISDYNPNKKQESKIEKLKDRIQRLEQLNNYFLIDLEDALLDE